MGLWQDRAQPSSHMQGSGPGTQIQAALLEEHSRPSFPLLNRPVDTLAHTCVGGEGAAMARPRGLKGTLAESCISTGDTLHGRAGRKETSF